MATSNIPGVNAETIGYVQKMLLPDKSLTEAAAVFVCMIEDSRRSWFPQFNFFLHNLTQLRLHGDHYDDGHLLSFVPNTFTQATDGRIAEVTRSIKYLLFLLLIYQFLNYIRLEWLLTGSATTQKNFTFTLFNLSERNRRNELICFIAIENFPNCTRSSVFASR